MLFSDLEFLDRFAAAAKFGFRGVEYLSPYEYKAKDIRRRLEEHDLRQVIFNMPAGNRAKGDRGIACQPSRREEFLESIPVALEYARELRADYINCLAGIVPAGLPVAEARETYVGNLREACAQAAAKNIKVVIEPLNAEDFPGFLLTRTDQAVSIIDDVGARNLGIEYDIYHAQKAEGNLTATLRRFLAQIWHVQIADVPTRQEPGTGEIRFDYIFSELDRLGYEGWIGCDYHPSSGDAAALSWIAPYLSQKPAPAGS
jgi:hydroxypyruvate isomerase